MIATRRYAIVPTSRDAWSGASALSLVEHPGARRRSTRRDRKRTAAGRSSRLSQLGPRRTSPLEFEDLELGGEQLQTYPADPKGLVRDGTPLNLVILARVGDDGLDEQTREAGCRRRCRLFGHMHTSSLSGDPVVDGKKSHRLLMPWLHLRSQEQREGDLRTGAPAARRSAAEKRERPTDRRRRI